MIRIDTNLTTPDGGIIATSSVVDVTPIFKSRIVDVIGPSQSVTGQDVQHDCYFDVKVYRSIEAYEARTQPIRSTFGEFNTGFVQSDIDISAINGATGSLDTMFGWLQTHIENGDADHSGTGTGSTTVVYPFV
jgi:hypothetical protein